MDQVNNRSRTSAHFAVAALVIILGVLALCLAGVGFGKILQFSWQPQAAQPTAIVQRIETFEVTSPICGTWTLITTSNLGADASHANIGGLAALSQNDVWLVGSKRDAKDKPQMLFMHWDGSKLSPIDGPMLETENVYLNGISAIAHDDIWAVGSDTGRTLIMHWNGTAWGVVPSPNVGNYVNELNAVSAISSTDIWAVGYHHPSNRQPLAMHWDGVQWATVAMPPISADDSKLYGVEAVSSSDIWAVGYEGKEGSEQPLTMHWDGHNWSVVPNSVSCEGTGSLVAVSASGPRNVWAVGNCRKGSEPQRYQTLSMHWDGNQWRTVQTSNNDPSQDQYLAQVSVISNSDVWSVGFQGLLRSSGETLVQYWNGRNWSIIPRVNSTSQIESLVGVVALSPEEIWAVGKSSDSVLLAQFKQTACAKTRIESP